MSKRRKESAQLPKIKVWAVFKSMTVFMTYPDGTEVAAYLVPSANGLDAIPPVIPRDVLDELAIEYKKGPPESRTTKETMQ